MMRRVALITGATRRIGFTIAQKLGARGYSVVAHCSEASLAEAKASVAKLAEQSVAVSLVAGDLRDPTAPESIMKEAGRVFGPLGLLVNNAALFEEDTAFAIDLELWERHFAVNLRAPILLAQSFIRQVPVGEEAAIVNLIDQRVLRPTPQFFSYSLTKSALWMATQTLAEAYAPRNVRVNGVGPGPVLPSLPQGEDGFAAEVAGLPLRHAVSPEEIAEAVLYLAEARSVTGQLIAVDAGQHLAWRTPDVAAKDRED